MDPRGCRGIEWIPEDGERDEMAARRGNAGGCPLCCQPPGLGLTHLAPGQVLL